MAEPKRMELEQVKRIAEVLLGAAHADGRAELNEEAVIYQLLGGVLDTNELPQELVQHISRFDAAAFDLEQSCAALELTSPEDRRQLLKLVAQVTDVDDVQDLDEGHYIVRLARCIGAGPEEYAHLAAEATSGPSAGATPPPVPTVKR